MLIILLGGIITIALTQNAEAGSIITTRSNIKSGKAPMDVKGSNNQLSTQDVIIQQYNNAENNCGDGSECSNSATFEIRDISGGSQTNDFLAAVGDSNNGVDIGIKENGIK
jgi:hypothetical protein